jgi:ATP-binding cassette subfamily B protein
MVYLSGRLTLVALIPMPLISLMVFAFVRITHRQSKKVQELYAVVTTEVQENLAGARVVKAYGMGDRAVEGFRENATNYMKASIRLVSFMSFAFPFIGSVIGVIMLIVTWYGGSMVIRGEFALADYTAFMIYLVMLAFPLAHLGWVLTLYQRGAVGMNRIAKILGETPDIWDDENTNPDAEVTQGRVQFDDVFFAYGAEGDAVPVLRGISFEAPAGAMIAIVGPTGWASRSMTTPSARSPCADCAPPLATSPRIPSSFPTPYARTSAWAVLMPTMLRSWPLAMWPNLPKPWTISPTDSTPNWVNGAST